MTNREQELEKRLNLLVKFGGMIAIETNLNRLLELIAEQVKRLLNGDRCTVFVLDKQTNELWSKVAHGLEHTEIRMPFGKGIVGIVAQTGQPINIKNAYSDDRFSSEIDRVTGYKTRNILAVPLKDVTGKIIGVFEVINKMDGDFDAEDEGMLFLLGSFASAAIENAQLYESLNKSQLETIYRLAITAEYRDQVDTAVHLRHISEYSALLAKGLPLSEKEVENIRYSSPLHDIGKVGIPDAILLKPGKLTPEEYEEMKKHTLYGAKILCNAESALLQIACKIAGSHHEKFDGTGYPIKLKGGQIPLYARIVSVADVFDALCMPRVYKSKWESEKAREYILSESEKSFDPDVVKSFEGVYEQILKIQSLSNDGKTTVIPGITKELHKHTF
ncbi:MAG: HD domain-containing protein [Elusimicrobia bacterium]|nr:HD domain-containing protein [Elusimicrobiota bacterium]